MLQVSQKEPSIVTTVGGGGRHKSTALLVGVSRWSFSEGLGASVSPSQCMRVCVCGKIGFLLQIRREASTSLSNRVQRAHDIGDHHRAALKKAAIAVCNAAVMLHRAVSAQFARHRAAPAP